MATIVYSQPRDSVYEMLEAERKPASASLALSAGMTLTKTPQIGVQWEFARGWQAGLEMRSWFANASMAQDNWPEVGIGIRRLWLPAEEKLALQSSEYIELSVGVFPSHSFARTAFSPEDQSFAIVSDPLGYRGMARIAIGKYWMPFTNAPFGLDANLVLGRYFEGHPPLYAKQDVLTVTFSVFWAPLLR
jgi:hypothetical protein